MCDHYKATNVNSSATMTTRKNNLDYIKRCKFYQAHEFEANSLVNTYKDVKVAFIISLHRYATRPR